MISVLLRFLKIPFLKPLEHSTAIDSIIFVSGAFAVLYFVSGMWIYCLVYATTQPIFYINYAKNYVISKKDPKNFKNPHCWSPHTTSIFFKMCTMYKPLEKKSAPVPSRVCFKVSILRRTKNKIHNLPKSTIFYIWSSGKFVGWKTVCAVVIPEAFSSFCFFLDWWRVVGWWFENPDPAAPNFNLKSIPNWHMFFFFVEIQESFCNLHCLYFQITAPRRISRLLARLTKKKEILVFNPYSVRIPSEKNTNLYHRAQNSFSYPAIQTCFPKYNLWYTKKYKAVFWNTILVF